MTPLFRGKIEISKDADRSTDAASWTWTDITSETQLPDVVIRRGRGSNDSEMPPGQFAMTLSNADGRYSPRNPESFHFPHIKRGLPVRVSVTAGDTHLAGTSPTVAGASTPDAAALDITGDISGVIEFAGPFRIPREGMTYGIAGKYVISGNQRSWALSVNYLGRVTFSWSTDGTLANTLNMSPFVAVPSPDAGPLSIGWYLDVNNGASGRTLYVYVKRGDTAALLADLTGSLHDVITQSGTTSIFSSTSPLDVGGIAGAVTATFVNYPGAIRKFQVRSGDLSTGTIQAQPDFTAQASGTASFSDGSRTWTVNSPATITQQSIRMVGELSANSPDWPANGVEEAARVHWEAAGIMRRLRQGAPQLDSCLRRRIMSSRFTSNRIAYWPMEDGSEAESLASPISGVLAMQLGTFNQMRPASDDTMQASKPLPSATSGQIVDWRAIVPPPATPASTYRTDLLVKMDTLPGSPTLLFVMTTEGTVARWEMWASNTQTILYGYDAAGTQLFSNTTAGVTASEGFWTLWALKVTDNGADVDWAWEATPIPGGVAFGNSGTRASAAFGRITSVYYRFNAPTDGISFGHLVVSTGLSLGWLAPADTAFVGEAAAQRVFRLCQEEGIPVAIDGIYGYTWDDTEAAGATGFMGPQRPLTLPALLQECADADHGYLSESREMLGIAYRSGPTLFNQTPTFTAGEEVVQPFEPTDDDQTLVNDFTATRVNGSSARYLDPDLDPDVDPVYLGSAPFNVETDAALNDYASWRVITSTWPEMRYPAVTVELAKRPSLAANWLDVTFGDIIRANRLPSTHPGTAIDQLVDGYIEEVGATHWRIAVNGSPAGPWTVGVLDTSGTPDDTLARLDTDGSHLNSALTNSDLTMFVLVDDGPQWTTDANHFPMDILLRPVGADVGEIVTVSAIGAPFAGVQTFTVTARSVNGVTLAHPIGTLVNAADPLRLPF